MVVDFLDRLFLMAEADGAVDVPAAVWAILAGRGKRLRRGGAWLDADADTLAELRRLYELFRVERRPLLTGGGIG